VALASLYPLSATPLSIVDMVSSFADQAHPLKPAIPLVG